MDMIAKEHAYRKLAAHGVAVGLSEGLMGNSEVGSVQLLEFNLASSRTSFYSELVTGSDANWPSIDI